MSTGTYPETQAPERIVSLDQFRGYTVLGMFLVNFLGSFQCVPGVLKHNHSYCSYADTIMPGFFFAVGFAYRMTFLRRLAKQGKAAAVLAAGKRALGLILLGAVVYHLDGEYGRWMQLEELGLGGVLAASWKRSLFQTLTHIGVTSLWVLPVIGGPVWLRILHGALSGLLHLGLSYGWSSWSNYDWVHTEPRGIDGGPLGFLTWTLPLLAGSCVFDAIAAERSASPVHGKIGLRAASIAAAGMAIMLAAYLLSCLRLVPASWGGEMSWEVAPAPFVHVPPHPPNNILTMSQRAGSVSYLLFGAGFSVTLYAGFVVLCDWRGWQLPLFRTLGSNALAAYLIHMAVDDAIKPFAPKDSPAWYVLLLFALFLAITWLFVRYLEKRQLYLRL
jgi:hypothetical protein